MWRLNEEDERVHHTWPGYEESKLRKAERWRQDYYAGRDWLWGFFFGAIAGGTGIALILWLTGHIQ